MEMILYDLYKDLKAKNILLSYCGALAQTSIEGIGNTLRRNLELEQAGNTTTLTVFSIFIEQVQNVLNYSAEKIDKSHDEDDENELRFGIITIGKEKSGQFFVTCGNKVFNQDIPRIKSMLESLKGLKKEELKSLYKERRKMDRELGSKGAGLGLIEMSRRAAEPIHYSFVDVDEEFSFFSIKVIVGG